MKYFDDNGNFKSEIKISKHVCYREDVDKDGKVYRVPYRHLIYDVWDEVLNNWDKFPAKSDIVATYWVSRAAGETDDNCYENDLLQRVVFSYKKETLKG